MVDALSDYLKVGSTQENLNILSSEISANYPSNFMK